jgi:hypothetical protein
MRDLFAVASLIPGIRGFFGFINDRIMAASNSVPKDYHIVGAPHVDNTKYITALMGRRDSIVTEILCANNWVPLPVTGDALAIFPSLKMTSLSGVRPTRHRVLLWDPLDGESIAERNITLSLSIIDRPANVGTNLWSARNAVMGHSAQPSAAGLTARGESLKSTQDDEPLRVSRRTVYSLVGLAS